MGAPSDLDWEKYSRTPVVSTDLGETGPALLPEPTEAGRDFGLAAATLAPSPVG